MSISLYENTHQYLNSEVPSPCMNLGNCHEKKLYMKSFVINYNDCSVFSQKKAVDSKSMLRFLATGLSYQCYELFKNICSKSTGKIPASKFDGLKGLKEEDALFCLIDLSCSNLQRKDWQKFNYLCQSKQSKPKKVFFFNF